MVLKWILVIIVKIMNLPFAVLSGPKGSIPGFNTMKVLNPPDDKLRDAIKQTGAKVVTSMFFGILNLAGSEGHQIQNLTMVELDDG